jgi:hypothetical protein
MPALGIALAVSCVWLTVRIANRRERWAKWTLAAIIAAPVGYFLSIGPLYCWAKKGMPKKVRDAYFSYAIPSTYIYTYGPKPIREPFRQYIKLWD